MKLTKGSAGPHKVAIDMTPMIDCVFQLIIFFMLTLKIRADEGDFNINMPIGMSQGESSAIPDIKVRLEANPNGSLRSVALGRLPLPLFMKGIVARPMAASFVLTPVEQGIEKQLVELKIQDGKLEIEVGP